MRDAAVLCSSSAHFQRGSGKPGGAAGTVAMVTGHGCVEDRGGQGFPSIPNQALPIIPHRLLLTALYLQGGSAFDRQASAIQRTFCRFKSSFIKVGLFNPHT